MGILRFKLNSTCQGLDGCFQLLSLVGPQQTLNYFQFPSFGAPKRGSPAKPSGDRHTQGNRYNTLNYVRIFLTGSTKGMQLGQPRGLSTSCPWHCKYTEKNTKPRESKAITLPVSSNQWDLLIQKSINQVKQNETS